MPGPAPRRGSARLPVLLALGAGPAFLAAALALGHDPRAHEASHELVHREGGYTGSSGCADCHPDQHASWGRTFHATMTQLAGPDTVLGAFDGRRVEYQGDFARVFEQSGRYWMEIPSPRGRRTAEVALCVGSNRYQQYFEREPRADGTFAFLRLPLLWHVGEATWMHLNTVFLRPDHPDWDGHRTIWNANCIFCHNTGPRPGVVGMPPGGRSADAFYASSAADLGIACEACHGPGAEHAERYRDPLGRYAAHLAGADDGDIVHPDELGQAESIALCGQCHGQRQPKDISLVEAWMTTGPTFRPGDALDDHVDLVRRDSPSPVPAQPYLFHDRFWSEGTPRLTAYEAQGLLDSPCVAGGEMTCNTCHSMHSGDPHGMVEPAMRTNAACTGCHAEVAARLEEHTGHPAASSGSLCLDCHMPRMVYGVTEIHRSHRIESPDPRRDAEGGRPNACTLCHVDESPVWAAREMTRIYGREVAAPRSRPSGASVELPDGVALLLAGDAVERAVMAAAIGRVPDAGAVPARARAFLYVLLAASLGDAYPTVRRLSRRSLLALEDEHALGLGELLAAWDPMETMGAERFHELVDHLASVAPERFEPPAEGQLLTADFRPDMEEIVRLLDLQTSRLISIGE